jgi:hypothetical protein
VQKPAKAPKRGISRKWARQDPAADENASGVENDFRGMIFSGILSVANDSERRCGCEKMPILQILFTWFLIVLVVLVLLGLAGVAMVSLLKGWIPMFWVSIVAAFGVVCAVVCTVLIVGLIQTWFPGDFPYL